MQEKIKYYPFEMKDYDRVYKLWEEIFPDSTDSSYSREQIQFFLERNSGTSYIADLDGRIIGAVLAGNDGRRGFIHHLGVAEEFRRYGVGRELMNYAERALADAGIDKVHLFVFVDNVSAKEFYDRIGYGQRHDLDMFSKRIK